MMMAEPQVIFSSAPVNMRLSPEKLATSVRFTGSKLDSGDVFIFFNRQRDRCKIIWHDGEAYCAVEKLLERGTFAPNDKIKISPAAIENLLYGGVTGHAELLHALMGNVAYISDARER